MGRGGCRTGAGAKSKWKSSKTKTIRVPVAIADRVLELAKMLDQGSGYDFVEPPTAEQNEALYSPEEVSEPRQQSKHIQLPLVSFDSDLPSLSELDFQDMVRKQGIEAFYYIVHIDNLDSILKMGILSHRQVEDQGVEHITIYNSEVIDRRSNRVVIDGRTLWDFANLYLQPRNAMLYAITHKIGVNDIAIIAVKREILKKKGVFITSGNAASHESDITSASDSKSLLSKIRKEIDKDWWNKDDGSKRKMMAECLVPDLVPPDYIQSIYVATEKAKSKASLKIAQGNANLLIIVEPEKFFLPSSVAVVNRNISIVRGDMFFSKMQTLTISVNCVGVMGKGLASTAKHRFPDVYVRYESLCKSKTLSLGKPYIHKRESSVLTDLGDDAFILADIDEASQTWFMLFPTKGHWKNNSRIEDIEEGLRWFCSNYKKQGVKSVAFPALGCGNGGLSWGDVGPLMCKHLVATDIPVAIYLPTEVGIPNEWITPDFLMSQVDF